MECYRGDGRVLSNEQPSARRLWWGQWRSRLQTVPEQAELASPRRARRTTPAELVKRTLGGYRRAGATSRVPETWRLAQMPRSLPRLPDESYNRVTPRRSLANTGMLQKGCHVAQVRVG
jgi:hypothetical protein